MNAQLSESTKLTSAQKTALERGKLKTVSDLVLGPPGVLAKKCKVPLTDMENIIDSVCNEDPARPRVLREVATIGEERFTTGEPCIDETLGGGIRTGMFWEICGEKDAGKTELALQLSLAVQLPKGLGGASGAACYITTREEPLKARLEQMIERHPRLPHELCRLPTILSVEPPTYPTFVRMLQEDVRQFADSCVAGGSEDFKPAKLVVIDTFSDIFDDKKHPEYEDIPLRARHLRVISSLLHRLAAKYQLTVISLCATKGTRPRIDGSDRAPGELRYSDQARWFSRACTMDGEDGNEGILGHIWPNQLNARIMMSRTIRTRTRAELDLKPVSPSAADERIPLRRFSVIFSAIAPPGFCNFVILDEGVFAFRADPPPLTLRYGTSTPPPPSASPLSTQIESQTPSVVSKSRVSPPWYQQSLSYATNPSSRQSTPSDSGYWDQVPDILDDEELARVMDIDVEEALAK